MAADSKLFILQPRVVTAASPDDPDSDAAKTGEPDVGGNT